MDQYALQVDIESLLWDMRDLVRNLSQVTKAQAAEIERLGGRAVPGALALESDAVIASCDAVLAQWAETGSDASTQYEPYDVAAWVKTIARFNDNAPRFAPDNTLQDTQENLPTITADSNIDSNDSVTTPSADVPSDFWDVHAFKWEDEPLVLDEQIPELWLDASDDASSSSGGSTARDDGATLFHPDNHVDDVTQTKPLNVAAVYEATPVYKVTGTTTVRRHTVLGQHHLPPSLRINLGLDLDDLDLGPNADKSDDNLDNDYPHIKHLSLNHLSNAETSFDLYFDSSDSDSDVDSPVATDSVQDKNRFYSLATPIARAPVRPPVFARRLSAPDLPRWRYAHTVNDDCAIED